MENMNVGILRSIISRKISDSYFKNELNESIKKTTYDFFNIVENSPILNLELKTYDKLTNKYIENEIGATRYIDNCIKLFEVYTFDEIEEEYDKLKPFIVENETIDDKNLKLFNSINTLIVESVKDYSEIDVDKIHESFMTVLNHVRNPKEENNTSTEMINERIVEIAIDKYNKKYSTLNEEDKNLIKQLIESNVDQKMLIFESYRKACIGILENNNDGDLSNKVNQTISKLNEMAFNSETADDDILKLYELNNGLR